MNEEDKARILTMYTWCDLSEEEAELVNEYNMKANECGKSSCFDCYGDRLSW